MIGTKKQIIDYLNEFYYDDEYLLIDVWTTYDVVANERNLSDDDAKCILDIIDKDFDASIGINWDVVEHKTNHYKFIKGQNNG